MTQWLRYFSIIVNLDYPIRVTCMTIYDEVYEDERLRRELYRLGYSKASRAQWDLLTAAEKKRLDESMQHEKSNEMQLSPGTEVDETRAIMSPKSRAEREKAMLEVYEANGNGFKFNGQKEEQEWNTTILEIPESEERKNQSQS